MRGDERELSREKARSNLRQRIAPFNQAATREIEKKKKPPVVQAVSVVRPCKKSQNLGISTYARATDGHPFNGGSKFSPKSAAT